METPTLRAGALYLILSLFAVATSADTVTYVYDALGLNRAGNSGDRCV